MINAEVDQLQSYSIVTHFRRD